MNHFKNTEYTSVVGAQHCCAPTARIYLHQRMINKNLKRRIYVDTQHDSFVHCVSPRVNPFKVVKLGTKIGHFNLQKAQNLNEGFNMVAVKQRILVGHLERGSPRVYRLTLSALKL